MAALLDHDITLSQHSSKKAIEASACRTVSAANPAATTDKAAAATGECVYRLKRVEIHRSDSLDQIKFEYTDGTRWFCGHDGGKADPRVAIMTQGEFIVTVLHERFFNFRSAGAAVQFTTNKGRTFGYFPRRLATKRRSETTEMTAKPGHEIIRLDIRRGVLEGIVEQLAPSDEAAVVHPAEWYTLVKHDPKKNDEVGGNTYTHFAEWPEAKAAWHRLVANPDVTPTAPPPAALLIDSISTKVLRKLAASPDDLKVATASAIADGFCAAGEEESVSVLDAVAALAKVLTDRDDVFNFVLVTLMLVVHATLELKGQMLTGKVLTMIDSSNATELIENTEFVGMVCHTGVMSCGTAFEVKRVMILVFMLVSVGGMLIYVANVWVHHNACATKNARLSQLAFKHVLSLDQAYFDVHPTAAINGGMNVHALNDLISWNIPYIFTKSLNFVMTFYFMATINAGLATICIGAMLIIKFGLLDPIADYRKNTLKVQRKLDVMASQIKGDAFNQVNSIKMFSSENHHVDEYTDAQDRIIDSVNHRVMLRCLQEFGYGVLRSCTFGAVLYHGLLAVVEAGLSSADLVTFFMLFNKFIGLFDKMKWHYDRLLHDLPDIDRYLTLMATKAAVTNGPDMLETEIEGTIEFKDVSFEYPSRPGEPALKGLNLTIKKNAMTAIVGESGAGKSTISRIIMRLYDPTQGSVLLDGKDLRSVNIERLHDNMAIVNQSPDLFATSIGENITYGAVDRKTCSSQELQDRMVAAAKLGNCYDFVKQLRGGFDTFCGSRGAQLSGGQRQRIAIARAAIRNPKILILDEATSALDAESEQVVQDALERIMDNRTVVVIAHRLSTIRNADEIICMKDGAVAEQGTHDALMARQGVYFNLISKQMVDK